MEISKLDEIRKLGIIAMFSDDELMEMLVLKGGNAMALFYSEYSRASIDLDFSLCGNQERIWGSKALYKPCSIWYN